jgi:hypothetical protein
MHHVLRHHRVDGTDSIALQGWVHHEILLLLLLLLLLLVVVVVAVPTLGQQWHGVYPVVVGGVLVVAATTANKESVPTIAKQPLPHKQP